MNGDRALGGSDVTRPPEKNDVAPGFTLVSEGERRRRWSPARAGIVNVWRYADETFEFHRGRLLLRGANGAGKSMALELLFPFLLAGAARRRG